MGSELEFYLFEESHEELFERNFADPRPTTQYIIDYHILGRRGTSRLSAISGTA
jgi:hypothetical protein